jgi:hypothetical protein
MSGTAWSNPWTLHEVGFFFGRVASGIVPTASNVNPNPPPLYKGSGTPYASYCSANGTLSKNHGVSPMQPYYFPFVRRQDDILVGYFDYRQRNEQEASTRPAAAHTLQKRACVAFRGDPNLLLN